MNRLKVVTDLKYVVPVLLMLALSLCSCSSLTDEEKVLLEEWPQIRLNGLYDQASDIVLQALEPVMIYFDLTPGSNIGLHDDSVGALEYLRDHDMSEQIAEVEAILAILQSMPDSPRTEATWDILEQRLMIINAITPQIEALKALNELGQSYKDKEIGELTTDEKWAVYQIAYWYTLIT